MKKWIGLLLGSMILINPLLVSAENLDESFNVDTLETTENVEVIKEVIDEEDVKMDTTYTIDNEDEDVDLVYDDYNQIVVEKGMYVVDTTFTEQQLNELSNLLNTNNIMVFDSFDSRSEYIGFHSNKKVILILDDNTFELEDFDSYQELIDFIKYEIFLLPIESNSEEDEVINKEVTNIPNKINNKINKVINDKINTELGNIQENVKNKNLINTILNDITLTGIVKTKDDINGEEVIDEVIDKEPLMKDDEILNEDDEVDESDIKRELATYENNTSINTLNSIGYSFPKTSKRQIKGGSILINRQGFKNNTDNKTLIPTKMENTPIIYVLLAISIFSFLVIPKIIRVSMKSN